ncbi:MAG: competence/damage-inducible protein A [Myxococcales bacterium]|nr:competence/damage-inducible protein A [Myxococcales bacterium]
MSAAVLCIGTELTRGEIVNTNASWLAETLTDLGIEVTDIDAIPDDRQLIVDTLHRLSAQHTVIVCTGGLGPTTDDITSECVATVLNVPLVRDEASLDAIRVRMEKFGRSMATSNAKQADFPEGARILPNRKGTAPGFSVALGDAQAFFMPGVPREMKTMFGELVAPSLSHLTQAAIHQVRLKTFGMTESGVNDKLDGIEAAFDVTLAYRAHFPEIEVKVHARAVAEHPEEAAARARRAADEVLTRLGSDVVYGEGDVTFAEQLGRLLVEQKLTLAVAESCTGGSVSRLLTERGGSSAFFLGGAITYANSAKQKLVGVPAALLDQHGAVSAEVARAMAEGVRLALAADVALALTGIAGPTGGTADKPVGLVHFAVSTAAGTSDRQMVFPGSRAQIRDLSAFAGMALVRKVVLHGHGELG